MQKHKQENAPREYTRDASPYLAFALEKLAVFPESSARGIAYTALPTASAGSLPAPMRLREPCPTPHHPMHASHPAAPFTAAGMSKISVSRIAFLETGRIIALPASESNRKEQSAKPLGGGLALPCANPWPPMAQPCLPWVKERSAPDERNVGYG